MRCPRRPRWTSTALAALSALAFAGPLGAQVWQIDPSVAPALVHESNSLSDATFVAAPAGQFIAYGDFTHVNGTAQPGLARFGTDGKLDPTFAPNLAANERVLALAPLADGRSIAIISTVTTSSIYDPRQDGKLTRLLADGRKDPAFTTLSVLSNGSFSLTLTPTLDGRVLIWGGLTALGSRLSANLARLNPDGAVETSYSPWTGGAEITPTTQPIDPGSTVTIVPIVSARIVTAVAPAADGSVVVSGIDPSRNRFLTRFLPNGSIDSRFAPTTIGETNMPLVALPDGSVLAGNVNVTRYTPTGAIDRTYTARIPLLKTVTRFHSLPGGRLAIQATVGAADVRGTPAVFTLASDGQLERDFRQLPGARAAQRLLATQPDGRVLVVQGSLVGADIPVTFTTPPVKPPVTVGPAGTSTSTTATAVAPITPSAEVPLADPSLAISPPDASAGPTTPLVALPLTITIRQPGAVNRLGTDSAGRLLVSGWFTYYDSQPRAGLARLLASGALDPSFVPPDGELIYLPPDGRPILRLTTLGPADTAGYQRSLTQIVRLQPNGSVDPAFAFPVALDAPNTKWLATAPDGRLLLAAFEPDASREENLKLIWLAADGRRLTTLPTRFTESTRIFVVPASTTGAPTTTDLATTSFPSDYSPPNLLDAVQVLADGRLLVAGAFSRVNGIARPGLVRLQSDGTLDASYTPDFSLFGSFTTALPLPDGRTLVFGGTVSGNQWRSRVLGLRVDGSVDPTFQPPTDTIYQGVTLLDDGSFFSSDRRWTADGWPDLNFTPRIRRSTFASIAWAAATTADGRLWLGGYFDQVSSQSHSALVRFNPTDLPAITVPPKSQKVVAGSDAFLQVALGTAQPTSTRWTLNGTTIPGATTTNLRLSPLRPEENGDYRAIVTIGGQTFTSAPATLTVLANTTRLVNFSARSVVSPAAPQIAGLVCAVAPPRPALLRAVGLGLEPLLGLGAFLAAPVLTLYDGTGGIVTQDRGNAQTTAITTLARTVGAFPLSSSFAFIPGTTLGSALAPSLGAGSFTAATTSGDGRSGLSLFEFYDTGTDSAPPLIRNLSIRGQTAPGAAALTAGFVLSGNGPRRIFIRGLGPTLVSFGVTEAVADPQLELRSSGMIIARNSGWAGAPDLAAAARAAGAFALPAASRDAALFLTLEPGAYTAQLSSTSGQTGTAMIEVYVVDN
ncbi:MAG: hypothetical protein ACKVVO_14880 [Opitutaceae bacterium]